MTWDCGIVIEADQDLCIPVGSRGGLDGPDGFIPTGERVCILLLLLFCLFFVCFLFVFCLFFKFCFLFFFSDPHQKRGE